MNVIVHQPSGEAGLEELARRVAMLHADAVIQYIERLSCPVEQKAALIDAVIAETRRARADR